ncbi:lipocalin family protein [Epilithonimonas arachidiradicis]|uniref:Lipocalin-like protein n=1 Tax=Epilithonimonas arachidiradicis TaxID=1617282 RepID=A0A420CPS7_9FLAO|nr:lipocalin family protein [Epilithonimonas arachidiradicis]RKE80419.1 lipocalin-like protein [Epilithonimonas arachidiradicis]GGG63867.1 hypothetical protein GCM10007332_27630 [Epilithonimonas arachidiradicis]
MKKLILFALASLAIISCRKDDDESKPTIVGNWKISKSILKFGNGSSQTYTLDSCESQNNFTLQKDGKMSSVSYGIDFNGNCVSRTANGTFSYDEQNKRLVMYADEVTTVEVSSITKNELIVISIPSYDNDNDGKEDKLYIYFTK